MDWIWLAGWMGCETILGKPEGIREAKERERREDTTPAAARYKNVTYAVSQSRKGKDASQ